jgi:hypothetical protein
VAVGEQVEQPVVDHLVGDLGAGAAGAGVSGGGHDRAALSHPQERRAQTTPRDQLVDGLEGEQVAEAVGAAEPRGRSEQRPPAPDVAAEGLAVQVRAAREGGARVLARPALVPRAGQRSGPAVSPAVGATVRATVRATVALTGDATGATVGRAVRATVGAAVRATVRTAVRTTVALTGDATGATVGRAVLVRGGGHVVVEHAVPSSLCVGGCDCSRPTREVAGKPLPAG